MFIKKELKRKILRNKKLLERKLKVKLRIKNDDLEIEGNEFNHYIAEKIIEALDKNFPLKISLLLLNEGYILESINIKDITRRKNLKEVRARIIGTHGKTLRLMSELSGCYITLTENTISILGPAEKIKETETAIKSLIRGSKQRNVYRYLEKQRKKDYGESLGLKIKE